MLGDDPTNTAELLAPSFGRRYARYSAANVVLRDPSTRTSGVDGGKIDSELGCDTPDDRGGLNARLGRGFRRGRACPVAWRHRCSGRFRDLLARLADEDELGAHRRDLSLGDEYPEHRALVWRWDLDRRLVGLDLDERVVLVNLLALDDEPAGDLAFSEALAEIRELECVGHYA